MGRFVVRGTHQGGEHESCSQDINSLRKLLDKGSVNQADNPEKCNDEPGPTLRFSLAGKVL